MDELRFARIWRWKLQIVFYITTHTAKLGTSPLSLQSPAHVNLFCFSIRKFKTGTIHLANQILLSNLPPSFFLQRAQPPTHNTAYHHQTSADFSIPFVRSFYPSSLYNHFCANFIPTMIYNFKAEINEVEKCIYMYSGPALTVNGPETHVTLHCQTHKSSAKLGILLLCLYLPRNPSQTDIYTTRLGAAMNKSMMTMTHIHPGLWILL